MRRCQRRLDVDSLGRLPCQPLAASSVGALGHFSKRAELGGGAFETKPDEWISVSLVYTESSRPVGVGNVTLWPHGKS